MHFVLPGLGVPSYPQQILLQALGGSLLPHSFLKQIVFPCPGVSLCPTFNSKKCYFPVLVGFFDPVQSVTNRAPVSWLLLWPTVIRSKIWPNCHASLQFVSAAGFFWPLLSVKMLIPPARTTKTRLRCVATDWARERKSYDVLRASVSVCCETHGNENVLDKGYDLHWHVHVVRSYVKKGTIMYWHRWS